MTGQFQCRTEYFKCSFFPSTIDLWNNTLPESARQIMSVASFKRVIGKLFEKNQLTELQRMYFCSGDRQVQIVLSQMRMQFSNLKTHLYDKQCIESPLCPCGESDETIYHFYYNCKLFATARLKLYRSIFASFGGIYAPCVDQILYGNTNYNIEDNSKLLQLIINYITDTRRFG